jgi:hypothetical protein
VSVARFIADRRARVAGVVLSRAVGLRDFRASWCPVNHRREQVPCCTLDGPVRRSAALSSDAAAGLACTITDTVRRRRQARNPASRGASGRAC